MSVSQSTALKCPRSHPWEGYPSTHQQTRRRTSCPLRLRRFGSRVSDCTLIPLTPPRLTFFQPRLRDMVCALSHRQRRHSINHWPPSWADVSYCDEPHCACPPSIDTHWLYRVDCWTRPGRKCLDTVHDGCNCGETWYQEPTSFVCHSILASFVRPHS